MPIDYAAIAKDMDTKAEAPAQEQPAASAPEVGGHDNAAAAAEKPAVPAAAEKPATPGKPEPVQEEGGSLERAFEKLVGKQAELRKEKEAAKHGFELANIVSPVQAASLKTAVAQRDPIAVLNALGFSYSDAAKAAMAMAKPAGKPAEPQKTAETKSAEPQKTDPEIEEIRREYRQMKAEKQTKEIHDFVKQEVGKHKEKLKHVSGLEAFEEVHAVLSEMFNQAGAFPSEDPAENVRIAAEEAERRLAKKAEKFKRFLTPSENGASVSTKAPETPAPAHDSGGTTLTNDLAAPAVSKPPAAFNLDATVSQLLKEKWG